MLYPGRWCIRFVWFSGWHSTSTHSSQAFLKCIAELVVNFPMPFFHLKGATLKCLVQLSSSLPQLSQFKPEGSTRSYYLGHRTYAFSLLRAWFALSAAFSVMIRTHLGLLHLTSFMNTNYTLETLIDTFPSSTGLRADQELTFKITSLKGLANIKGRSLFLLGSHPWSNFIRCA